MAPPNTFPLPHELHTYGHNPTSRPIHLPSLLGGELPPPRLTS
jgi:hypothetical protein